MKKENNILVGKLLFFIVWPFGAFLHSLRKPQMQSSRIIFFLWFVVFGLCFMPVNEEADSYQYAQEFVFSENMNSDIYHRNMKLFFSNSYDSENKDVYVLTMMYLVSRVTNNVHVLFMLFAIVFGFFYVKSMKYALNSEGQVQNDLVFYILMGWFCISNPIFNINGVRFWTAAWIGVFIMFRYLITKDYKVLLLLPILYLVHASFVVFILVFLIYVLLGRYHKVWNVVFVISLFFSGISFLPMVSDTVINYLPRNLQFMLQYYSSEDYLLYRAERMATLSIYAQLFSNLPKIMINLIAAVCLLNRKKINNNVSSSRILEFSIVLLSLTNILSIIPSVSRFLNIVIPFFVCIFLYNRHLAKQYKWVIFTIPIMYTYPVYLWLFNMHEVTSYSIFVTPLPFHIINYLFV